MTDDRDPILEQLHALRPVPRASFRGDLRRRLLALGPPAARPRHLRALATFHAAVGVVLLAVGLAGVLGAGPFGA